MAKAVADLWRLPLLRLDVAAVFGGGAVAEGQSLRETIKIAESLAPAVLWIDEIEKGFSGASSTNNSDGGLSRRMFGTMLTWMQEHTAPVFLVATANDIEALPVPVIAAVNGFALGGGCELAMLCDFIVASDKAKFGQPEINLGVAPGIGGSQRLTRLVGKSKAMDMVLTARMMDAAEALASGLASRVVPHDTLLDEVRKIAAKIASQSPLAVMANKEMVNAALETTLTQGVQFERRLFHSLFAFEDQKEGMAAFVEKRKPVFTGR
jgi:enoyl-CoA hydratase